ncbi:hypothetical protein FHT72_002290 [Rhizobium sp. BK077]|uniref:hypothetical protein n=1 Tax=unclassified Rhizobium TaxID=2613769 RepID=UPI0012D35CDB|nr:MULTISPECIES: hypothetical protein [unclassified Rhizobium]MBB3298273.1 hypothetical protein [Rhizobium sp. BK112]MBB3367819.1 hypothetical protein [Rhizobium sp. BK077]MBB4178165.1 hypothetical protein [Rhizobium sp. BK109]
MIEPFSFPLVSCTEYLFLDYINLSRRGKPIRHAFPQNFGGMVAVRLTQSSAMTVVGSFAYFSRREKPRCPRATGGARLHKFPTGERCHLWLGIRGAA